MIGVSSISDLKNAKSWIPCRSTEGQDFRRSVLEAESTRLAVFRLFRIHAKNKLSATVCFDICSPQDEAVKEVFATFLKSRNRNDEE